MKRAGFSEERVQDWSGRADKGIYFSSVPPDLPRPRLTLPTEMMNLSRPMWMRM